MYYSNSHCWNGTLNISEKKGIGYKKGEIINVFVNVLEGEIFWKVG